MINLGIIGLGGIARLLHCPQAVQSGQFRLAAAADLFPDNGVAQAVGIQTYYDDYRKLLADPSIDAVLITSPHDLHAEHCCTALQAGKHVFVEKPIARNLKEASMILDAAEKSGTILMIGFNERFTPIHAHIKSLVDAGTLGALLTARIDHYQNFNPAPNSWWRSKERVGGGCVIGSGIHRLDLLRWYLGEPTEVYAKAVNMKERLEAEACVHAVIAFESGAIANFSCNWAAYSFPHYEALSIAGKDGLLTTDSNTLQLSLAATDNGALKPTVPPACESMYAHFSHCIKTGAAPLTNGSEGYKSLRLARAIYTSIETGRSIQPKAVVL